MSSSPRKTPAKARRTDRPPPARRAKHGEIPRTEPEIDVGRTYTRELATQAALDPAQVAYLRKRKGQSWIKIARDLGYSDQRSAEYAVQRWLQRGAAEATPEVRRVAFEISQGTYEEIKRVFFKKAKAGDKDAAAVVLKAQERLDRLYRFGERDDLAEGGIQTIIVPAGDGYARTLREIFLQQAGVLVPDGPKVIEGAVGDAPDDATAA